MIDKISVNSFTRFVMPSILMMMFISVYNTVDGIFIARLVGPDALGGLNIAMPIYSIAFAIGVMFATGGGAIIAVRIGRGEKKKAASDFTFLTIVGIAFGVLAGIICLVFRENLIAATGAGEAIRPHALDYSLYMILAFPFLIVKVIFEDMLRVDGKPRMTLDMTLLGGGANILLDYIFMGPLKMGIAGAGLGTLLGIIVSLIPGLLRFTSSASLLRFKMGRPDFRFLLNTMVNGSSEMVNEAALSVSFIVFNTLALRHIGNDGLAAVAVIMALSFLGTSVLFGYAYGVSPLISYNYGRANGGNQQKIMQYSMRFLIAGGLIFFGLTQAAAPAIVEIYLKKGSEAFDLALRGLRFASFGFLITGINIFASALFTAFENGKISALISFLKSFVIFMVIALVLPAAMGRDGIWLITPITEFLTLILSLFFIARYQKRYSYSLKEIRIFKRRAAA